MTKQRHFLCQSLMGVATESGSPWAVAIGCILGLMGWWLMVIMEEAEVRGIRESPGGSQNAWLSPRNSPHPTALLLRVPGPCSPLTHVCDPSHRKGEGATVCIRRVTWTKQRSDELSNELRFHVSAARDAQTAATGQPLSGPWSRFWH